jgi:hypothetical protein
LTYNERREISLANTVVGMIQWDDLYAAMATALVKRNVVVDDTVATADDQGLEAMGKGLGCPANLVALQLGGK